MLYGCTKRGLFLTQKSTATEAVETSVTNSLSQDYSNLDDLLSLTCTDSLGFKPFTVIKMLVPPYDIPESWFSALC